MQTDYDLPKRLKHYVKRLTTEYRIGGQTNLAEVLGDSEFQVVTETAYDNWNGGTTGHDVIFFVPDHLMGNIPLDGQQEISSKIAQDLNKASSAVGGEYIETVHFEYKEDNDSYSDTGPLEPETATRIWLPNTVRLFISHRDTHKKQAHELGEALELYGVSSFVAHDSIEPDEDWQLEIEKALQTMNALLAFLTDDFFASPWTNQEVGYALARNIPVFSFKTQNTDPVGFIRNKQAVKGDLESVKTYAPLIVDVMNRRMANQPSYRIAMINRFVTAASFATASESFLQLQKLGTISADETNRIADAFNSNSQLHNCYSLTQNDRFLRFLNAGSPVPYEMDNHRVKKITSRPKSELPF